MIRFCWICTYLCVSSWTSAQSPDPEQLFEDGDFLKAAVWFEKAYFDTNDLQRKNYFLLRKAQSYKALEQFDQAILALNRARFVQGDSLKAAVNYESVLLNYLAGDYQEAYVKIAKDFHEWSGEV